MRLKTIKLAGFKSFVDPTTVPFPHNLSAVVGPNGCGKSNIIDAVRWVMGESSAKHLRGESMTDVIFNGSNTRKPIGQASIELIFDNNAGKLVGEYARFSEISVKRRVTREGQSEYYLNGTKCRRRDITDLFLGTGLGPRSYAIIEQGMISRLIESKPEELRVYIEEAAGISKYKERRKETESRMKRTQENLDRLTDLRDELGRQLQHLQKQAQSAEKYTELKKEERHLGAQLNAMKWHSLNEQVELQLADVNDSELKLEREVLGRSTNESAIDKLRSEYDEFNIEFQRVQARFYETGAEIARAEQSLQHSKDRVRQHQRELTSTVDSLRDILSERDQEGARLEDILLELEDAEPRLEELSAQSEDAAISLEQVEQDMQQWQHNWEDFNHSSAGARQTAEVEQSRIQNTEAMLRRLSESKEKLAGESELLLSQLETSDYSMLQEQVVELDLNIEALEDQRQSAQQIIDSSREAVRSLGVVLAESRSQEQRLKGELSSKLALQKAAMGDENKLQQAWLLRNGLNQHPRFAQSVTVAEGWDTALESVLGDKLQAISVDNVSEFPLNGLADLPETLVLLNRSSVDPERDSDSERKTLYSVTQGAEALRSILDKIYLVAGLDQGLQRRSELADDEVFICPDGTLIAQNWIRVYRPDESRGGVLRRQQDIDAIELAIVELTHAISDRLNEQERRAHELQVAEQTLQQLQKDMTERQRARADIQAKLGAISARQEQISARLQRITTDQSELGRQWTQEQEKLAESREVWQEAMIRLEEFAELREDLLAQRDKLRQTLDELRQTSRHRRDQAHQVQLQVQALRNQKESLNTAIDRFNLQHERLLERRMLLEEELAAADEPIEEYALKLEGLLESRNREEAALAKAREQLDQVDQLMREKEKLRHSGEQVVMDLRAKLEKQRMNLQALQIHRQAIEEELEKDDLSLPELVASLPEDAHPQVWQESLEKIAQRVQRLGAINLAAIDEYQTQSERKRFLDEQNADLVEALETLEAAIRKIDRETRARFKETFDKVNAGLQALFPKVFGGGMAYLDLTGEDLLETGVTIMARPPGKKNSTIHLLSGGEKALTAIALIFSIFQLNPAPFCMLDEVDAPLDDANVARYANMVKDMSDQVQFIYITHNKIAMEMADQLMGVTMHEPGVSRLVSVDVEEAAALAAL
ncbi:MAG: chromosome segregation protein SMC [Hahellaceae bacterium]|nr:chromosome segregation protein SMC [Hahellaceae bacterium]